jgi:hypothetical protein
VSRGAPAKRRARAAESFKTAAECIGPIDAGVSVFAITRGQFSMIDAVLHVLDCLGPSVVSLWTWTVAEYEIQCLERLRNDARVTRATLIIDHGARNKNKHLIADWKRTHGADSVRYVINHAKIATVEGGGRRVLLRGSMNLNFNPRFEQLDVTEGGPDFDLVRRIEAELPILADDASGAQVYEGSKVSDRWNLADRVGAFGKVKPWKK